MSSRIAAFVVLAALSLLGACADAPTYPLLTPVDVARSFGYSDIRLPDGSYEVSYVAPALQGFGYRFDQSPTERQGKTLAYDMAIWRAAQIAQLQGYRGFSVADSKSNSDIQQRAGYYDDPWGPGWGGGPGWGPGWGGGWGRGPRGWNNYYYNPPETSVQVEVKLAVTLSNNLKPGDYDAANAIDQLRRNYPGADSAGVAPLSAAPPLAPAVTPIPAPATAPAPSPAPSPAPVKS